MPDADPLDRTLDRMCAEFLEMPGMRLTLAQAQRLWGLDQPTCRLLLNALLEAGFLRLAQNATYTRASDGPAAAPRLQMAKADTRPPRSIAELR